MTTTTLVQVLVGTNQTPLSVHKHTICKRSKWFQTACFTRQEKVMALPYIGPAIFGSCGHWMNIKSLSYGIR
jgi:hypothetical protein